MNCKQCGYKIENTDLYCPACGVKAEKDETLVSEAAANIVPADEAPLFQSQDYNKAVETTSQEYQNKSAGGCLAMGILSVVLSALNYCGVPFVHLAGFVLGIIAVAKTARLMKLKVKFSVGAFVTGLIGLILGAVAMLIGFIYGIILASV